MQRLVFGQKPPELLEEEARERKARARFEIPIPTHAYIARKECGCCIGVASDIASYPRGTAEGVASFIKEGLTVERVTWEVYREQVSKELTFMQCPHKPVQPAKEPELFDDAEILLCDMCQEPTDEFRLVPDKTHGGFQNCCLPCADELEEANAALMRVVAQ